MSATWPARIYRIDEAQENLMLIGDIIEDGIHILDLTKKDSTSDEVYDFNIISMLHLVIRNASSMY